MKQAFLKLDRFGSTPRLNFHRDPVAASYVGSITSVILFILLGVCFGLLLAFASTSPSTTTFVSPMNFDEEMDVIPGDLKFCVIYTFHNTWTPGNTEAELDNAFAQKSLKSWFSTYVTTKEGERIDQAFSYCPDVVDEQKRHCICLEEPSIKLRVNDKLNVKMKTNSFRNRNFDLYIEANTASLIPNEIKNPFTSGKQVFHVPFDSSVIKSGTISFDKIENNIDKNPFYSTPKKSYSVLPKIMTSYEDPDEQALYMLGWTVTFTGQTISSTTTTMKILDILAQVGALNGVLILVFTIILGSFFNLKYYENLVNRINNPVRKQGGKPRDTGLFMESLDKESQPLQIEEKPLKKDFKTNGRDSQVKENTIDITFFEWLRSWFKKSDKVEAIREQEEVLDLHFDVAQLVRNNMELEFIKRYLFSKEQLDLLEGIPFNLPQINSNPRKVSNVPSPKIPAKLVGVKGSQVEMEARFNELIQRSYEMA